ncbi:X-linked retinitis pigmentosa GTPase regulator [Elysia marginata]|uniref:X-linked retinitis pigmentosa GTPase regulator n=1 Tax=Elysia marginata TaxID=1093978 RepID=A0AAV4J0U4_9GAST|nr:X-linked retinitis pigmentosa GTPase regulator [Elysia marginata]
MISDWSRAIQNKVGDIPLAQSQKVPSAIDFFMDMEHFNSTAEQKPREVNLLRGQGHTAAVDDVTTVNGCCLERDPMRSTLRHQPTLQCCPGVVKQQRKALTSVHLNAPASANQRMNLVYYHFSAMCDGIIFAWGFGSDGQLGLGDRKLTSSTPRRVRHESLRQRVSFIACGETFSAAVTADGRLYMWGKNSHVIAVSHAPSKAFFHPVAVDQDERLGAVHSVHCGSWHSIALSGRPDRQPTTTQGVSDSESGSDGELTSGSSLHLSGSGSQTDQTAEDADRKPFPGQDSPIEQSVPPVGHQDHGTPSPNRSTSKTPGDCGISKLGEPGLIHRGQTKLTIGEFYAMTDSSPSLHENGSRGSQTEGDEEDREATAEIKTPLVVAVESPSEVDKLDTTDEEFQITPSEDQENIQRSPEPKPIKHRSAPASAKSSSDSSEVSESSLKKRMAENLSANNTFKSKESWGMHPQTRHKQLLNKSNARSSNKTVGLASPSPMGLSPRSPNMIPRSRSTEQPATAMDRSHTMFISRTPAEQFLLPRREPTFMACQSLALVDLNDLRQGSVFDHEDSGSQGFGQVHGHFQHSGLGQGSRSGSSIASRLDMLPSPTDCDAELNHVLRQRTPLMATYPHFLSASETPSAMSFTHQRAHDLLGPGTMQGQQEGHVAFASPSPNLGRQVSNPLLRRSRTMYSQANVRGAGKFYRKPGLPGAGYKPVTGPGPGRSLVRQTTSLDAIPKSQALNGVSEGPDLAILTTKQSAGKPLQEQRTGNCSADEVSNRKAVFSSASSWRSRQHTSLGFGKDSVPTIPVRKNTQLHLNGIGANNNANAQSRQSDSNSALGAQALAKLGKQSNGSTHYGRKIASFSDIQRDDMPKKQLQGVEIRAKSVKKYR